MFLAGGGASEYLKNIEMPLVDHDKCSQDYSESRAVPRAIDAETMLCAGGPGRDVCKGDAGGPLQIRSANSSRASTEPEPYCSYKIVGVISFGQGCFVKPGVYTRVQLFVPWIERNVWSSPAPASTIKKSAEDALTYIFFF